MNQFRRLVEGMLFGIVSLGIFVSILSSAPYALADPTREDILLPFGQDVGMSGANQGKWTLTGVLNIVVWIVQWAYTILFIFAVFIFLVAAYNFILGGSNEDRIKTAKNQLKWGVVAIVVALLSVGVSYAIDTFLRTGA